MRGKGTVGVVGEAEPAVLQVLGRVAALGYGVRLLRPAEELPDPRAGCEAALVPTGEVEATVRLVRELRERHPDLPLVAVADDADARAVRALWRAGAADFLYADEPDEALAATIGRVVALARPELELVGPFDRAPELQDEPTGRLPAMHLLTRSAAPRPPPDEEQAGAPPSGTPDDGGSSLRGPPDAGRAPPRGESGTAPNSPASSGGAGALRAPTTRPAPPPNPVLRDLPVMDPRLPELERLMERETCDFKEIDAFVSADPSLVVTLIRAANAAYYRSPKLITNLRDACVRVGNRQVFALLMETLVQRSFTVTSPEGKRLITACWRNATLTARLVRRLSEWTGLGRPEDLYVAGLLHNLGELVLVWRAIDAGNTGVVVRLTNDAVKITNSHEGVGRIVATRWGLPPLVQILTAFHHQPRPGGRPEDERLRLAVLMSWALARQSLGEYLPGQPPADPGAFFDEFGLPEAMRARLTAECAQAMVGL